MDGAGRARWRLRPMGRAGVDLAAGVAIWLAGFGTASAAAGGHGEHDGDRRGGASGVAERGDAGAAVACVAAAGAGWAGSAAAALRQWAPGHREPVGHVVSALRAGNAGAGRGAAAVSGPGHRVPGPGRGRCAGEPLPAAARACAGQCAAGCERRGGPAFRPRCSTVGTGACRTSASGRCPRRRCRSASNGFGAEGRGSESDRHGLHERAECLQPKGHAGCASVSVRSVFVSVAGCVSRPIPVLPSDWCGAPAGPAGQTGCWRWPSR